MPLFGHFTPGIEMQYPEYRRLGGPWCRFGRTGNVSPLLGVLKPVRPVRSELVSRPPNGSQYLLETKSAHSMLHLHGK